MRCAIFLFGVVAQMSQGADASFESVELERAKQTLRKVGLETKAESALSYFRKRTLSKEKTEAIQRWIRELGADEFEVREEASRQLVLTGESARAYLERAKNDEDPERKRRVRRCLDNIEEGVEERITYALIRILAAEAPRGSLESLLAYVPQSKNATTFDLLVDALRRLGIRKGKVEPALLKAIEDKEPLRRSVATAVIGRFGGAEHRPLVVRRLKDSDADVRFRAAYSLAYVGEKVAVPTLIELLVEGPVELAYRSENLLFRIAREKSPEVAISVGEPDDRKASYAAWRGWFAKEGKTLALKDLELGSPMLGIKLVCELEGGDKGTGHVFEYGPDGKVRWEIHDVKGPIDAQRTPSGRVLLAELHGNRVTERDREGKITFEKKLTDGPQIAQPLRNGNIFIATYSQLLEVNRAGETLYTHTVEGHRIYYAKKLRSGRVFYVGTNKEVVEIDPRTKKIFRTIPAGDTSNWGSVEPLPNGNFLVARCGLHTVAEITPEGKDVRTVSIEWPTWATRLPNGHTVVACAHSGQVAEFDREGKQVWHRELKTRPCRCRNY